MAATPKLMKDIKARRDLVERLEHKRDAFPELPAASVANLINLIKQETRGLEGKTKLARGLWRGLAPAH